MSPNPTILLAARHGDRKAQYELYRMCFPMLRAMCARYRCDEQDAISAVNQAFLKIVQNLDKYHTDTPFEAWIRRIQINVLIDEFRKTKQWRSKVNLYGDESEQPARTIATEDNIGSNKLDAGYLERLLQQLPAMTQQVFNLFAIDGYSHAEIGTMLDMSEGTSKWHVSFARSKLKAWLANDEQQIRV